ncbi:sensor histidine kinase [Alistipes sp.]|uniref:sensor histidine kinase n=1 Tax=Alistipes sp. TaxID=1872444 RepID=UPI003AF17A8A
MHLLLLSTGIVLLTLLSIWLGYRLLGSQRDVKTTTNITELILKNIDAYVLLVDADFNVQRTNYYDLTATSEAKRPPKVGNLLRCKNGMDAGECGTHEMCATCPVRAAIGEAFRTGRKFSGLEAPLTLYTSEERSESIDCEVSVTGIFLRIEEQPYLLLTIHDITADKRIRRELDEARIRAEESDRMKSFFLANTSHELRTPLNAIVGFSDLLIAEDSAEIRQEYARIIHTNNELLLQLVNDILDLSKIEAGTLEYAYRDEELNAVMEELEGAMHMRQEPDSPVKLTFCRLYPQCRLTTDRKRLSQVLSNFLTNAIKFTERGEIVFGYEIRDDEIYFYVRDTGSGIPEEKKELLFRRFVKVGSSRQGVGIGLAISKSIVESMGGRIGVESREGAGSTFWFTLPRGKAN